MSPLASVGAPGIPTNAEKDTGGSKWKKLVIGTDKKVCILGQAFKEMKKIRFRSEERD
jgi:hypothetical protein